MNEKSKNYLRYPLIVRSDLDDAGLSDKAFRLLAHFARRQGTNQDAQIRVQTISTHLRWDRKTTFAALNELRTRGWVAVRRGGRSSRYTVLHRLNSDGTPYVPKNGTPESGDVPQSGTSDVPANGTSEVPNTGTSDVPANGTQKGYVLRGSKEGNPKKGGESTPASGFPSGKSQGKDASEHQRWDDFKLTEQEELITPTGSKEKAMMQVRIWRADKKRYGNAVMSNEDAIGELLSIIDKDNKRTDRTKEKWETVIINDAERRINVLEKLPNGSPRHRHIGVHLYSGRQEYTDDMT